MWVRWKGEFNYVAAEGPGGDILLSLAHRLMLVTPEDLTNSGDEKLIFGRLFVLKAFFIHPIISSLNLILS